MLLTARLHLQPDALQAAELSGLLERAAAARAWIAERASESKVYRWRALNDLVYYAVREQFQLPSNLAQSLIRQVSVAAKKFKGEKAIHFKPGAAIPLISRYVKPLDGAVRIKTLTDYVTVPIACWTEHAKMLKGKWREAKLYRRRDGELFLHLTCEIAAAVPIESTDFIGVDLGIVQLATDSDGSIYSGEPIKLKRRILAHRRRNLQRHGTRAAKRKLRFISNKQQRYQRHVNHVISKTIVGQAFDTGRGITLENLKGIRSRVKVRRRQRATISNWGFWQLRFFIEYKAKRAGVPVVLVDPRNSSRTCPDCGHVSKSNRRTQAMFNCQSCGLLASADYTAARNIRARALTDAPMVAAS